MQITLYNTDSDNATLIKQLDSGTTLAVLKPTDGLNLDTPVIDVQYNPRALTANYAHLTITQGSNTVYSAYYFIQSRAAYPAEKVSLSCVFDPLMTYATGILQCDANVIRNQAGATYVSDDKYPIDEKRFILHVQALNDPFTKNAYPLDSGCYVIGVNT